MRSIPSHFKFYHIIAWATAANVLPLTLLWYGVMEIQTFFAFLFVSIPALFMTAYFSNGFAGLKNNSITLASFFRMAGISLFFLMALWMVAEFSWVNQPVLLNQNQEPIRIFLAGPEVMAFTLRIFLQSWGIALALALLCRALPEKAKSGFFTHFFDRGLQIDRIFDWVIWGGVSVWTAALLVLSSTQLASLLADYTGMKVYLFPQTIAGVILIGLYIVDQASGFSKQLKIKAESGKRNASQLLISLLGFLVMTWAIVQFAVHHLPAATQSLLAESLHTKIITRENFEMGWVLLIESLGLLAIVPLTLILLNYLKSKQDLVILCLLPVLWLCIFGQSFPAVSEAFWQWKPVLSFFEIPFNEVTAIYHFNPLSLLLFAIFFIFCLAIRQGIYAEALEILAPEPHGRRTRRVNRVIVNLFPFFIAQFGVYGFSGMQGLAYLSAIFAIDLVGVLVYFFILGVLQVRSSDKKYMTHCGEKI